MRDIFFEIHQGLPREGPGDRGSTLRAFRLLTELPPDAAMLDVGCGPGQQTIDLARIHPGRIIALDTHPPYLDVLRDRSVDAGVADRVQPLRASMLAMPLADGCVGAIWAEGSIYIAGFEQGLLEWKRLLRPGGYMAVTHLSWLVADVPPTPREFWSRHYPAMTTVDDNLAIARARGLDVIGHFTLPESAWWNDYYGPMERRLAMLRERHREDAEALAVIEGSGEQIELYRRFAGCYGYVFYILRSGSPEVR